MNEEQYTEALDAMTDEEVAAHFEALMALALSIEETTAAEQEPA